MTTIEIGVKAIIERYDTTLLMKRSGIGARDTYHNLTNAWDIPGGRIKISENLEEGLEREVAEETGLKIRDVKEVLEVKKVFRSQEECIIRVTYICSVYDGPVILSREHTMAQWFQRQELRRLEYRDNILRETVEKYCERGSK